ncbi:MAG: DUF3667 domain-containing protein [Muribaculaceae bacterium]|nr:DUF3667 domain-containing protein [Muribaculaceae bacterium]
MNKIRYYWTRFRQWQKRPYQPEPLNDEQHVCLNCGESFNGQYCPRCGQNSNTDRLTPRRLLAGFLDVWGAGNRSMPRNILHLLFRPGYMIADYLKGHRQPYFPPFKMLFIFVTTFFIITSITGHLYKMGDSNNQTAINIEKIGNVVHLIISDTTTIELNGKSRPLINYRNAEHKLQVKNRSQKFIKKLHNSQLWLDDHRAVSILIYQCFFAFFAWLLFRKSPRMGNLALSEQLFAQIFISSQIVILSFLYFLLSLLWVKGGDDDLPGLVSAIIYLIDYKQLYGFGWWKTLWKNMLLACFTFISVTTSVFLIVIISILLLVQI